MALSILLTQKICTMLLMVFVGYISACTGALRKSDAHALSALTLKILCPALILSSFFLTYSTERLVGFAAATLIAALVHGLLILLARLLARRLSLSAVERGTLIYTNAGNLLLPLIYSLIGKESAFYAIAYFGVQIVLLWTHGVRLLSGARSLSLKKQLLNPNFMAIVLGLALYCLRFRLPETVTSAVDTLGSAIAPISMLSIGLLMYSADVRAAFRGGRALVLCLLRLLVLPALIVVLLALAVRLIDLPVLREPALVVTLACSTPAGVAVAQLAELCGGDAERGSLIAVLTTVFCIVTMPLIVLLYQALC